MGDHKKKGSRLDKYLAFGSASGSGNLACGQSDEEKSPGAQTPQQGALSPPTTGHGRRFLDKLGWRSPSLSPARSPGHETERRNSASDQALSLAPAGVLVRRPHSSYSDSSALQTHGPKLQSSPPTTTDRNITGNASPSSACAQGSSTMFVSTPATQISHSQSESIASGNPTPPTDPLHAAATMDPSSQVGQRRWT